MMNSMITGPGKSHATLTCVIHNRRKKWASSWRRTMNDDGPALFRKLGPGNNSTGEGSGIHIMSFAEHALLIGPEGPLFRVPPFKLTSQSVCGVSVPGNRIAGICPCGHPIRTTSDSELI